MSGFAVVEPYVVWLSWRAVGMEWRMLNEKHRFNVLLFGTCGMLLLAVLGAPSMLRWLDAANGRMNSPVAKKYNRVLAEGLQISKHGCYGIDFVKCGSCRLEKRKTGPLTFGGLNVLAIDDLQIVLPPKTRGAQGVADEDQGYSDVRSIARRLGVSDGFLSSHGLPLRFSGLRIKALSVNRLSGDMQLAEKLFTAENAEAIQGGLALSGCTVFREMGHGEFVDKATLTKSGGGLCLSWRGGKMML